jgi:hypothetical protein
VSASSSNETTEHARRAFQWAAERPSPPCSTGVSSRGAEAAMLLIITVEDSHAHVLCVHVDFTASQHQNCGMPPGVLGRQWQGEPCQLPCRSNRSRARPCGACRPACNTDCCRQRDGHRNEYAPEPMSVFCAELSGPRASHFRASMLGVLKPMLCY